MNPKEPEHGASAPRRPRIFWFGMHKVLVQTEFRLLQEMGYEVFRPRYLSHVVDQSVSSSDDFGNARLPHDVRDALLHYDFFYNSIEPAIAELLGEHFDAVVVTINPDWLKAVLEVFEGTVVYRCYGQVGSVSDSLAGCHALLRERADFHFLPHAPECLDDEAPWLSSLATVVPYWLSADVLARRDSWQRNAADRRRTVALTCPNISNPFYNTHFRYLKRFFEERCFRYYGVQIEPNADPNVVGTLDRQAQLDGLSTEAAFLYTYRERNVCYLPPLEMMTMGGPVLYLPGSLLARYFDDRAPGLLRDEADAVVQSKRLIAGDAVLAAELIDSQAAVAFRYSPAYGEPTFRYEIERILPFGVVAPAATFSTDRAKAVLLVAHIGGYLERDGQFASIHGIPRVMRQFVRALNEHGIRVSVTYAGNDRAEVLGFFASGSERPELIDAVAMNEVLMRPVEDVRSRYAYAVVAHYHFFPEANDLALPLLAYIPDYLPHFFEGRGWYAEVASHIDCGRRLAAKARCVLTNSDFSKSYLPASRLQVPAARISVFPLPFLGSAMGSNSDSPSTSVPAVLASEAYVFYPTQPHPHKRLDLLVMAWVLLNKGRARVVRLVLTAGHIAPAVVELVEASSLTPFLHLVPAIEDAAVEWLYANARCLAFSSELEGNFPTQVLEALRLDCPVVCFDIPLIETELGQLTRFLQVAPFGDVDSFAERLAYCVDHRDNALRRQNLARQQVLQRFAYERFRGNVMSLHGLMQEETPMCSASSALEPDEAARGT